MAEWTSAEQTEFTHLYEELKKGPNYDTYSKKSDEQIFKGEQLPYKEAKSRLLSIIEEQKMEQYKHTGNLEAKTNSAHSEMKPNKVTTTTRLEYGLGLAGVLMGLGLAASGLPPITYLQPLIL
ncbi:hypothetical protein HYW20_00950 [Candidatus Woesearchaeota archaeon]|nr:hypothetical protein [Candidatus Woesearchaeota archaeon]